MRPLHCTPCIVLSIVLLAGCTHYRYDVSRSETAPATTGAAANAGFDAGAPTTVMADRDLVLAAAPARLRFRQLESRCVLLIENPTDTEITLDGPTSAIVDPLGQTRAIATQLIPPGAFTKLILPPLRDTPSNGPAFQFGIGVMASNDEARPTIESVQSDAPRPAMMFDVGRAQDYWEWSDDKPIRLVLTFKQKDQVSRHAFTVTRTKE